MLFSSCKKNNDTLSNYNLSIYSLAPDSGIANTLVSIKGKNFSLILTDDTIKFNGVIAQIKQISDTVIEVYAPIDGITGPVSVSLGSQMVTGPTFTYNLQPPIIDTIRYDTSGYFSIYGKNFDSLNSIIEINKQIVQGFVYSTDSGFEILKIPYASIPHDLNNPLNVTVTVKNITSNSYELMLTPKIISANSDTIRYKFPFSLQGSFFGNLSKPSSIIAYMYNNGDTTRLYPDPAYNSWNNDSIDVSLPNYNSYAASRFFQIGFQIYIDTVKSNLFIVNYDSQ